MKGKYNEHVNESRNQKKLKKLIEQLGHTSVEVWWEAVRGGYDMGGYDGGFMFCSDICTCEPLGYSFEEAWEYLNDAPWFVETSTPSEYSDDYD